MRTYLAVLVGLLCSVPAWAFSLCVEDVDYPPYILTAGNNGSSGIFPDMVRAAANEHGQAMTLLRLPWRRCIDEVRKGNVDALAAAIWTPDRDAWGAFPRRAEQPTGAPDQQLRLWREEYRVFVPITGQLKYEGGQFSASTTGIGAPPGYVAWQRLKDAGLLSNIVLPVKKGLKLVARNRLDGYVSERNTGLLQLKALGVERQVRMLPESYLEDDAYLVFSHSFQRLHPELTQAIWQSLPKLRQRFAQTLPDE